MGEIVAGLIAGLLFGLGLSLSGMADPSVVLGFLDLAGEWNPALLFVMTGGVTVTFIGYRIVLGRGRPFWSKSFQIPAATAIDAPLVSGSVIFGIGWGLAGYCPGPALVSLASGNARVVAFVMAMLMGMLAMRWMRARPSSGIASRQAEGGA